MINFSKISQKSLGGKILRGMLKIIPKNFVLPILQGRLKGKKWIIGSGVFGYWMGTYESEKQRFFGETVKNGDIVYDIGAHAGFYTLLAAELVGKNGRVFSFEPNPRNIFYLEKHIKMNNYKNINIFKIAVSDNNGVANFDIKKDSFSGQFSEKGELRVKTVALDELIGGGEISPPTVVKIDVEGAEFSVLKGMVKIIERYHPFIFLATHNAEAKEGCLKFLKLFRYNLKIINGDKPEKSDEFLAYF